MRYDTDQGPIVGRALSKGIMPHTAGGYA
jgi:hypothetical protein